MSEQEKKTIPVYLLLPITLASVASGALAVASIPQASATPIVRESKVTHDLTPGQATAWEGLMGDTGPVCAVMNNDFGVANCTIEDFKWRPNQVVWLIDNSETGDGHWQVQSPVKRAGNFTPGDPN